MNPNTRADMGLSEGDMVAVTKGWYENIDAVQLALLKNNKYVLR